MKDVPLPYIRANQSGIIAFVILAFLVQLPLFIAVLWLIELIGLLFGVKANLFIQLAKPFLSKWIDKAPTKAGKLFHNNITFAVIFLTISFLFFELGWALAGYVVAGILVVAVLIGPWRE